VLGGSTQCGNSVAASSLAAAAAAVFGQASASAAQSLPPALQASAHTCLSPQVL